MSQDLGVLLEKFLSYLRVERGLSRNTQASYRYQINAYLKFLRDAGRHLESVTREDIHAYFEQKKNADLKSASLFAATVSVRNFHRFLISHGYMIQNPTAELSLPKFEQTLPSPLSTEDMEKLLASSPSKKFHFIRLRAALELLYSTGLRVSELTGLTMEHINFDEGLVRILGKGSKERIVPFGKKTSEALLSYLETRKGQFPDDRSGLVFLSYRGRPLTRGGFWLQLKQWAKRVGIRGRVFPHQIRHTAVTHLLDNGADIRILQEYLGHTNITVTQRYAHVSARLVRKMCQESHPRF